MLIKLVIAVVASIVIAVALILIPCPQSLIVACEPVMDIT